MPDARTHDVITVVSGVALASPAYAAFAASDPSTASALTGWLVGAHLLSGIMFSPDLDIDSAIDDRWGPLFWIWRPYMWLIPHRRLLSHGLVIAPLLRLGYFYLVVMGLLIFGAWALRELGVAAPYLYVEATEAIFAVLRAYPSETSVFVLGFITGSAAHSIADWLVTGGKRYLRMLGFSVRGDYRNHDRGVSSVRSVWG